VACRSGRASANQVRAGPSTVGARHSPQWRSPPRQARACSPSVSLPSSTGSPARGGRSAWSWSRRPCCSSALGSPDPRWSWRRSPEQRFWSWPARPARRSPAPPRPRDRLGSATTRTRTQRWRRPGWAVAKSRPADGDDHPMTLLILAAVALAAGLALATRDPASSMAALAAGGVAGVVVPGLAGWLDGPDLPSRLPTTHRGALAILGSGLLGLAVIAWGASAAGPLGGGTFNVEPAGEIGLGLSL